jgi:hypothetical protein
MGKIKLTAMWAKQVVAAILCMLYLSGSVAAQTYDTASIFRLPVQLDSFVVRSGFDVRKFISRVQTDTTFYKSFRSMHFLPYTAHNNIKVADKKGGVAASLSSVTRQHVAGGCRTTTVVSEQTTGDFYKANGKYNYYTAELFASLFFAPKPVCNETDIVAGVLDEAPDGQIEKRKYELKLLIFNPGSRIKGVPFMAGRQSIFEEDEAKKYDFAITVSTYNGEDAYVFKITPKPEYRTRVIYNELTTWFRKSDYSIVARNYALSYHTLVYDFDVQMQVRLQPIAGKLYPTFIAYDGNWHVFTQKRERVRFTIDVDY